MTNFQGMVEKWLLQVENLMLSSVRHVVYKGMLQYSEVCGVFYKYVIKRVFFFILARLHFWQCGKFPVLCDAFCRCPGRSGCCSGLAKLSFVPPPFFGPLKYLRPSRITLWL